MNQTDHLVDRLVSEQLRDNPRTRSIYNSDAMFHASVEKGRLVLQVMASEMAGESIPPWRVDKVLRATLDRILSDRVLDQHDALIASAFQPLYDEVTESRMRDVLRPRGSISTGEG